MFKPPNRGLISFIIENKTSKTSILQLVENVGFIIAILGPYWLEFIIFKLLMKSTISSKNS